MRCSVVIPAHNEEALLPHALASVRTAASAMDDDVEIVVVANRCSDGTVRVARAAGATVVENDVRNIAAVRNHGASVAHGDAIVTLDADCVMDRAALVEVTRRLATGRYVGGGATVRLERSSPGIVVTLAVVEALTALLRVGGGMFWCARRDFDAIGGFSESLLVGEDVEFAHRLRRHGRGSGRCFSVIRNAPVIASARKFDRYGDWHMFRMVRDLPEIRAALRGRDSAFVDRYFFDFDD